MDPPLFPDYYSQQSGIPLEASEAPNRYVREMTDEFWHSQRTRAMDGDTMPHFAYMPSPLDPDRPVAGVHMYVLEAMGDMPANIRAIHDTNQAIMSQRREMESQA